MVNRHFSPHKVQWTPEHIRRFWTYFAGRPDADQAYFSSHSGDAIIATVERHVPLRVGRVLDYGCGPGFLLGRLLQRGVRAEGVEFSAESVEQVRKRCGDHPLFGGITLADGVPTPIKNEGVDVVFLVEVLEHLPPEQLAQTLGDIRRILRGDGFLVVTTPNSEDLDVVKTICPDCGCIFHPWQHVASFNTTSLPRLFGEHAMQTIICKAMTFGTRWQAGVLRFLRRAVVGPPAPATEPHLIYIGRKRP